VVYEVIIANAYSANGFRLRQALVVAAERSVRMQLRAMAEGGQPMDPATYAARPLRQRGLEYVAMLVMRLALLVTGKRY
jgi:cardiolipin synthase